MAGCLLGLQVLFGLSILLLSADKGEPILNNLDA